MSLSAACSGRITRSHTIAAQDVRPTSNSLKVSGIDTNPITAQVIELEPRRDGAYDQLV